jgi:hypothetical protein
MMHVPDQWRIRRGPLKSTELDGCNGAFAIPTFSGVTLNVIASNGGGWEHVSVSAPNRTPTWEEMCFIKDKFWDPEDCVIQYHPRVSEYVNCHPHCLHMWKPLSVSVPEPPSWMVGAKS